MHADASTPAYYLGDAAAKAIGRYGLYAAGGALVLAALGFLIVRRVERRVVEEETTFDPSESGSSE